jgi:hypothetical protein
LAAIGGILGSCGTLLVVAFAGRHWTAFGAIATALGAFATFSAVLVALYPVWQKEQRRIVAAKSVRIAALVPLNAIATYLTMVLKLGAEPLFPVFGYDPACKALDRLVDLLPRMEVLEGAEQHSLVTAVQLCDTFRTNEAAVNRPLSLDSVKTMLSQVIGVYDRLALQLGSLPFEELPGIKALNAGDASNRTDPRSA